MWSQTQTGGCNHAVTVDYTLDIQIIYNMCAYKNIYHIYYIYMIYMYVYICIYVHEIIVKF